MRSLVCGDIHCKLEIIKKIQQKLNQYDKIIFLGDYVDDWEASSELSYQTLKELVDLKLDNPNKVVLLIGNHDLSEGWGGNYRCSGFQETTHSLVKDLYKTRDSGNAPIFGIAYSKGDYLFTHAGITNNFWQDTQLLIENQYPELKLILYSDTFLATKISNILNYAFLKGLNDSQDNLFKTLGQAGASRGGWETPSPLWADRIDLESNSVPRLNQIVGHTPVKTITRHRVRNGDKTTHELFFCDTHSSSYLPYLETTLPIGDGSFLEIDFEDFSTKTVYFD